MTWRNWAGNQTAEPIEVARPTSTDEVAELVRAAAARGVTVKAVGASHSFTDIAATDGVLVRLDRMSGLIHHDPDTRQVRVRAGTSLHELNPLLHALGLALPNLGDVDPQSVAGAISTGTHGTGSRLYGIAAAVVGAKVVTGTGEVVEVGPEHPWFGAIRVGLGALGIITEVTFQCVPAFFLHAREEPMALAEVMDRVDEFNADNDHFEFYWFPHTDKALVKRNNRHDGPAQPVSKWKHLVEDEILSNGVFEAMNRLGTLAPRVVPRLNRVAGSVLSAREYVDESFNVFVSPRRVRFRESEFAMPRAALPEVIAELGRWYQTSGETVSFPVEIRFAAADDIWLSTGHERDNVYVAAHQYHRAKPGGYFAAAQQIFTAHEGRPHWGKLHTLGADYFRTRYPRFADFLAVRDAADPQRRFRNPYLDRVLGP